MTKKHSIHRTTPSRYRPAKRVQSLQALIAASPAKLAQCQFCGHGRDVSNVCTKCPTIKTDTL